MTGITSTFKEMLNDIKELKAENARLRAALEAVEYTETPDVDTCPWCGGARIVYWDSIKARDIIERYHEPDCQRQTALGLQP